MSGALPLIPLLIPETTMNPTDEPEPETAAPDPVEEEFSYEELHPADDLTDYGSSSYA